MAYHSSRERNFAGSRGDDLSMQPSDVLPASSFPNLPAADIHFNEDVINSINRPAFGVDGLNENNEFTRNLDIETPAPDRMFVNGGHSRHVNGGQYTLRRSHDQTIPTHLPQDVVSCQPQQNGTTTRLAYDHGAATHGLRNINESTTQHGSWKGPYAHTPRSVIDRIRRSQSPNLQDVSPPVGPPTTFAGGMFELSDEAGASLQHSDYDSELAMRAAHYQASLACENSSRLIEERQPGRHAHGVARGDQTRGGAMARDGAGGYGGGSKYGGLGGAVQFNGGDLTGAAHPLDQGDFDSDVEDMTPNHKPRSPSHDDAPQPASTTKKVRKPRISKAATAANTLSVSNNRAKRRKLKSTAAIVVDTTQLLVPDLARARNEVIRRVPLQLPRGVVDDVVTVASNADAMILKLAAAFNQPLATTPECGVTLNAEEQEEYDHWQKMGNSKCSDASGPHMNTTKFTQGCAWFVWDELMDAHLNNIGPRLFMKEKIANGTDETLTCSQRFDEIVRVIGGWSLVRKDVFNLERIPELVANPSGFVVRKEENRFSNLLKALRAAMTINTTNATAGAGPATAAAPTTGALKVKPGRAKKPAMNASMIDNTGATAPKPPTQTYLASNDTLTPTPTAPGITSDSGTHAVRPKKRKSQIVDLDGQFYSISDDEDSSPCRKRAKPSKAIATIRSPILPIPLPSVTAGAPADTNVINAGAEALRLALAQYGPDEATGFADQDGDNFGEFNFGDHDGDNFSDFDFGDLKFPSAETEY